MINIFLEKKFHNFCKEKNYEINKEQVRIINLLDHFLKEKKGIKKFFSKNDKYCFYLHGDVGVGKTMLLDFVYEKITYRKKRIHFNEFMLKFHDFKHRNKGPNTISNFVKDLKSNYKLIYLDEFQVTNIVDAMILGKLFETIFTNKIMIIITTNTKLKDLYKDGLQREQFLPFIKTIEKFSIQKELLLKDDYRLRKSDQRSRIFYPLNKKTLFKINQQFRSFTRDKKKQTKFINTKGRKFKISEYYGGVIRLSFSELCDRNVGSEDYLNISKICKHIFIENIPFFNENNSNQQLRFINCLDIFYDKKITLTLSLNSDLKSIGSSIKHRQVFKRTLSRIHEMTSTNITIL